MLNKRVFILGLSLALMSIVGMAQGPRGGRGFGGPPDGAKAGGRMGAGPMMGGGMMAGGQMGQLMSPLMARMLEIDDAQRTAIRERIQAAAEESKPLREQQKALRVRIEEAVKSNAGDAALEQLASESGRIAAQSQAIALKTRSAVYNTILTPAQRTKLEELRQEFQNRPRPGRRGPATNAPQDNDANTQPPAA